uniref:ZP domain-containing protein n=1 Tax=Romanomermis culicivorax TaxID=13658 RepID=A0A915L6V0_ROMCU
MSRNDVTVSMQLQRSDQMLCEHELQDKKSEFTMVISTLMKICQEIAEVELDCGPKMMTVKLLFDREKIHQFLDWILVGNTKDGLTSPECKLKGTGDLQYLIEMPVMSGPCGTKAIAPGIYENVISIKKHPNLILTGDQNITVRCAYGAPEVATAAIPLTPHAAQPPRRTTVQYRPPSNPIGSPTTTSTASGSILPASTVYLIIFSALFSSLLFLFCGAVVFFLKRRAPPTSKGLKLSSKNSSSAPAAVAGDVFSSVCASSIVSDGSTDGRRRASDRLQMSWWADRKRKNPSNRGQHFESSHDYMVSTSASSRGRPVSDQGIDFRDNISMNLDLNEKVRNSVDKVYANSSSNKTVLRSIPEEIDRNHRKVQNDNCGNDDDKIETVSLSTLDGGTIYHCVPTIETDRISGAFIPKNDSADFLPTPPPVPSKSFPIQDNRKHKIFTKESYFDIFRRTVDYRPTNFDRHQSQTDENRNSYLDRSNCEIYEELPTLKVYTGGDPSKVSTVIYLIG